MEHPLVCHLPLPQRHPRPVSLRLGFLESALSSSPHLQASPSVLSQASRYIVQRSATPIPVASFIELLSRPLKATLQSSMKKSYRVRF